MATAEEWRQLAADSIQLLLGVEGATTQPGMEAKLADVKFPGVSSSINPHHLTTGRQRLLAAGVIEHVFEKTRGGGVVGTYVLSNPSKRVQRLAGRKRLLHSRYLSWSNATSEWGAAPVPIALERVVHRSLLDAAPFGYRLLRPEGGDISRFGGQLVPGGSIDSGAIFTGSTALGLPAPSILVPIEAKNLRQWIYPQTQELYQLLDKSARLRQLHPELPVLPVLVCRRAHYLTRKMAQQLGFYVITTWRQYVRPAVAGTEENRRKFDELNTELAYNLSLHEDKVDEMIRHFSSAIPQRATEASGRWTMFAAHPRVPHLVHQMRDDSIGNDVRHEVLRELASAAQEVFGEDTVWAHEAEDD